MPFCKGRLRPSVIRNRTPTALPLGGKIEQERFQNKMAGVSMAQGIFLSGMNTVTVGEGCF